MIVALTHTESVIPRPIGHFFQLQDHFLLVVFSFSDTIHGVDISFLSTTKEVKFDENFFIQTKFHFAFGSCSEEDASLFIILFL